MEAIRNYLEAMFANLPNTPEVLKAKDELWQMMEDNYDELIAQGKTENEAVGTVIAEFGNIDDLDLDLEGEYQAAGMEVPAEPVSKRIINREEAVEFLSVNGRNAFLIAMAVFLCITSVVGCILFDALGAILLCLFIGGAVALFVISGQSKEKTDYISKEDCVLDYATTNYVESEYKKYKNIHSVRLTIGVLLCAMCWMPAAVVDSVVRGKVEWLDNATAAMLFLCAGFGVLLLVLTSVTKDGYEKLLKLNDSKTVSGEYRQKEKEKVEYINRPAQVIMEVFWPTITCIFLSVSFLTFAWGITWIIWPVASIIYVVLKLALVKRD